MNKFFRRMRRLSLFSDKKEEGWFDNIMDSDLFTEEEKTFLLFNINEIEAWSLDDLNIRIKGGSTTKYREPVRKDKDFDIIC